MGNRFNGTPASEGFFVGPVRRLGTIVSHRQGTGDPEEERESLLQATSRSISDLSHLMEGLEGEEQDIVGFQLAMLEDDALLAPALAAVTGGISAHEAWTEALDAEISGYEASDDEYFRARATDLRDIRDRVLRHLGTGKDCVVGEGSVLVGEDLAPTTFLETDWRKGGAIALQGGSSTSHVAMLARARGIPMVVGLGALPSDTRTIAVDGAEGYVVTEPDLGEQEHFRSSLRHEEEVRAEAERYRLLPGLLRSGERIDILINVAGIDDLRSIDPASCDGIGLMRSEFLFRDGAPLPDEEMQYVAYRRLLEWAGTKPVTIRTLDVGGDKPISGLTPVDELNPFLGLRGVRLTLANEDVFRTQLRALARAAVHGNLKIMLPMITIPRELARSKELLEACLSELRSRNIPCARPPVGIMVEVPAVAIAPELFAAADFLSIGSNDLTQYVTAASRDDSRVASLNDPSHPAVHRLIAQVAAFGLASGTPVSLCGDMASDPRHLPSLLQTGLRSLSIAPSRISRIKAALAEL